MEQQHVGIRNVLDVKQFDFRVGFGIKILVHIHENVLDATIAEDGKSLKIGLRSSSMPSYYWVIFDNFRLHFFGNPEASAIQNVTSSPLTVTHDLYDLQGRRVQTAKPGLYILNGRKVLIK